MCGIFAYLNHLTPHTRHQILTTLLSGLKALEYKGYDSAGIAITGCTEGSIELVKKAGALSLLEGAIHALQSTLDSTHPLSTHLALSHTRWATHGEPNDLNAHPQSSGPDNEFVVIHNGIITNYKDLSKFLNTKGLTMQSETDTEVIVVLMKHLYSLTHKPPSFYELVEAVVKNLEGAFALVFKSVHYPEEMVVACKGSPLMIGVRSASKLATDHIPVICTKDKRGTSSPPPSRDVWSLETVTPGAGIEFFVSSDANAIIEFTNRVIYLEDNDVASVASGKLTIHKLAASTDNNHYCNADNNISTSVGDNVNNYSNTNDHKNNANNSNNGDVDINANNDNNINDVFASNDSSKLKVKPNKSTSCIGKIRQVTLLQNEIQQISKGDFKTYMEKEIYEQVDSVMNTMRGRVNFEQNHVTLGGIKAYTSEIGRCRRLLVIACATSYHAAVATRQLIEELTELSVMVDLASDFLDRTTPIFRDDVCIFLSQSGETADTLQALRHCKERGALIVGITNTVGSSVCRESHCGIHVNAGPEIGVASTKTYTSQFISLVLFSLVMCQDRISLKERRREIVQGLKLLPGQISEILQQADLIRELANELKDEKSLLFIGRGYNYATCLEGALKIKELTYMHSEGINAGELKHGPLALVDQKMPMVLVATRDSVYSKCINALQQITARHGKPIVICNKGDEEIKKMAHKAFEVPLQVDCLQGVLTIIPMQLLSLHIAQLKHFNVDQPRSLLKHHSEGDF